MGLKLGEHTCCPLGLGKDIIQIMLSGLSLLLIEKGHRTGYYIWVLNCWKWQLKFTSHVISLSRSCICLCVSVFLLVKSCLLITLIKCLKGHDLNRRLKVFSKYNCVIVFVLAFVILQDPGNPGVRPIMGPNVCLRRL